MDASSLALFFARPWHFIIKNSGAGYPLTTFSYLLYFTFRIGWFIYIYLPGSVPCASVVSTLAASALYAFVAVSTQFTGTGSGSETGGS